MASHKEAVYARLVMAEAAWRPAAAAMAVDVYCCVIKRACQRELKKPWRVSLMAGDFGMPDAAAK